MAKSQYTSPDFEQLAKEVAKVSHGLNQLAGALSSGAARTGKSATDMANATSFMSKMLSGDIVSAITQLAAKIHAVIPGIGGLAGSFGVLGGAIAALTAFVNPEIFKAFGQLLQLSVMPILTALTPVLATFFNFIAKIGVVVDRLAPQLNELAMAMAPVIDAFLDVGLALFQMVGRSFLLVGQVLASFLQALEPAANTLIGILDTFSKIIKEATPILVDLARQALPHFKHWLGEAVKFLVWGVDQLVNAFRKAINAILEVAARVAAWSPIAGELQAKVLRSMKFQGDTDLYEKFMGWLKKMEAEGENSRKVMNQEAQKRKELVMGSFGPKGGIGSLEGVWSKVMGAALGESPAEKEKRRQQFEQQMLLKVAAGVSLLAMQGAR